MGSRRPGPSFDPLDQPDEGLRGRLRRLLSQGDNPLGWSLPLYRLGGIQVRVHLFFVLYIAFELIFSNLRRDAIGTGYTALFLGMLFLLVLLHEYGHCLACRFVQGEADEILLWPLGGLASCRPPHNWRASLLTTLGGPAVNAVLWPILGTAVGLTLGRDAVLFNPFFPHTALVGLNPDAWWKVGLWWAYYLNFSLLAFNMLCAMFPLDAGRVVQELLWSRLGYRRSMEIATTAGLFVAGGLAVLGMVSQQTTLFAIAMFGGITCYTERQRLRFSGETEEEESPFAASLRPEPEVEPEPAGPSKAELRRREQERQEQVELDRILAKIKATGLDSLTKSERKALEQATAKRRGG